MSSLQFSYDERRRTGGDCERRYDARSGDDVRERDERDSERSSASIFEGLASRLMRVSDESSSARIDAISSSARDASDAPKPLLRPVRAVPVRVRLLERPLWRRSSMASCPLRCSICTEAIK